MEKKGSKNAYICDNLHATVTEHKDDGVTPMFIECPVCNAQATSRMGRVNQKLESTHEWYKPSEQDVIEEAKNYAAAFNINYDILLAGFKNHVEKGGLLMRKKAV